MTHSRNIAFVLIMCAACKGGLSLGGIGGGSKKPVPAAVTKPAEDKSGGGGGGAAAVAPKVAASEDDPHEIKSVMRDLDEMEKWSQEGGGLRFGAVSAAIGKRLFLEKEDAIWNHSKHGKLKQRYLAIKVGFARAAGPRAVEIMADGMPLTEENSDAKEAMDAALRACSDLQKISNSEDRIPIYEEKLARAKKIDAKTLRANGNDVRFAICEHTLSDRKMDFEDEYVQEKAPEGASEKKGCGKITWLADGVQIGSGKFAAYTRSAGGQSYSEEIPCGKVPAKDKFGTELARAVKEFKDYNKDIKNPVFVVRSKSYIEESKNDYRLHRWQEIEAYSKSMPLRANPCGAEKVFCEAGGSKGGRMFNELEHMMDRADVHAGIRPARCKEHLKNAFKKWETFRDFRDGLKKSGDWVEGATYKTKKGEKLKEKDFVAKFEKLGTLADERALGDYCSSKQASKSAAPATKSDKKEKKK
jgi:hypothetical protein